MIQNGRDGSALKKSLKRKNPGGIPIANSKSQQEAAKSTVVFAKP
jgi:hypothetical protein